MDSKSFLVIDPNTVRRIVTQAHVSASDVVVEIGPGLGSLTLALLPNVAKVLAVEIDPVLAGALPSTIALHAPKLKDNLTVINADAMRITELPVAPTHLVANLPYNVSVPVVLHFLETFPSLREILVMVQAEVADRLAAKPESKKSYCAPALASMLFRQTVWLRACMNYYPTPRTWHWALTLAVDCRPVRPKPRWKP